VTDEKQRIRKLIRPRWPYSWVDEQPEQVRYLLTLLIILVLGGVLLLVTWLRTGGL